MSTTLSHDNLPHRFRKRYPAVLLVLIAIFFNLTHVFQASAALSSAPASVKLTDASARSAYGNLPSAFILNAGQIPDSAVRYEVRSSAGQLGFTPSGVTLDLTIPANTPIAKQDSNPNHAADSTPQKSVTVNLSFDGANSNAVLVGADQLPGVANFFIGSDPSQWHTNVPTYAGVVYRDLYPGVDLTYGGHAGLLKGTYTLAAGVDPTVIRWSYAGSTAVNLDTSANTLHIAATDGVTFTEQAPIAWQTRDGAQIPVAVGYQFGVDGLARFRVGTYDPMLPLVIDPGLVYSTFLGGSTYDYGNGIAVDANGNAYVTGFTYSTDFPVTSGAFQTTRGGSQNAFVSKLNATGSALLYSTYLGGNSTDSGSGIAVDASGDVYVMGTTNSPNFPTTSGASQTTFGGAEDAFVSKLNVTGSALLYSTYLGGSNGDYGSGIALDSSGNAYVTGYTGSTDFPTTPGAFQTKCSANCYDVFVSRLNATGSALLYSTYLGGSGADEGHGIALDSSGNAYVTGVTGSSDFPTTPGAFQITYRGSSHDPADAFVSKLNATGSALLYSTYLGGTYNDAGDGIALDSSGNAYVIGHTDIGDFPTTPGAFQTTFGGGLSDVFVTKLNATGSALLYSTYLGGKNDEYEGGIALDSSGNAYVTGTTRSSDFPITPGAFQTMLGSIDAVFVSKLNATGGTLLYSTYLGGKSSGGAGHGIALDASGNAYITGATSDSNFPTTPGAFQTTYRGGPYANAFVSKLDCVPIPPGSTPTSTATNTPTATSTATNTATATSVPPAIDTIGIFRPSTNTFYLRNHNTTGYADITAVFNPAAKPYPVVGDWNGDSVDTIGIYDRNSGVFYLHNANAAGSPDYTFTLGVPNDMPLSGRWTKTATHAGVGVFRPTNGVIYLRNTLTTGFADFTMVLGIPGDRPIAGDWDGDGIDSIGVFRPSKITFYLSNKVTNGVVYGDYTLLLGNSGDQPIAGDWIGQGHAGVGVFRPTNGKIYLKNALTPGYADTSLVYGIAGDVAVAGHWIAPSGSLPPNLIIPGAPNAPIPTQPIAPPTPSQSSFDG